MYDAHWFLGLPCSQASFACSGFYDDDSDDEIENDGDDNLRSTLLFDQIWSSQTFLQQKSVSQWV